MQFHHLALERVEEQLHQRADLFLRPAPVLAGEREQRERGDPAFEAAVDTQVDRARTGAVADHPRPPTPRRPSAVAVHDNGEVAGEGHLKVIPPSFPVPWPCPPRPPPCLPGPFASCILRLRA